MSIYVGVTDRDWFDFLAAQPGVDEVNFWQPNPWGGTFGVLRRGGLFLFKLKVPVNAIAGGGFFEYYADLSLSLELSRAQRTSTATQRSGRSSCRRSGDRAS